MKKVAFSLLCFTFIYFLFVYFGMPMILALAGALTISYFETRLLKG